MVGDWMSMIWYGALLGLAGRLRHPDEGVDLESYRKSVELHYHVLGGDLTQRVISDGGSGSLKSSAHSSRDLMAWLDREQVHLPKSINRYASAALNREHFFWVAAFLAVDRPLERESSLPAGIRHLLHGIVTSARVLEHFPGLVSRYQRLCGAELAQRETALPRLGTAQSRVHQLEAAIRFSLGSIQQPDDEWLRAAAAEAQNGILLEPPTHWRRWPTPFLPVPLWGRPVADAPGLRLRWLKRKMHRSSRGREKPLSSPRFDLKRQPSSTDGQAIQGEYLYREWDYQRCVYHRDWCKVSEQVPQDKVNKQIVLDAGTSELADKVRRQFEALRQVSGWNRYLDSGDDVDIDACVDAFGDKHGYGLTRSDLYRSRITRWRDLSVAILLDLSRSTQVWVGEHRVIEIERQSMAVMAEALTAVGDDFALFGFASDSRLRVRCDRIKDFGEPYGEQSRRAMAALTPANYTRMGAAIRHVGNRLQQRSCRQKILLVLTDGRPHDPTDRYEGKYAVEDTRRALLESRALGIHCFGLTIDQHSHEFLPYLFGPGHYAVLSYPQSLPQVLPHLYSRITGLAN